MQQNDRNLSLVMKAVKKRSIYARDVYMTASERIDRIRTVRGG